MKEARGVVAHRLQVEVLKQVERLQHDRALSPARQLVNLDALVGRRHRLLHLHLPVRQVRECVQPALLARAATIFLRDVALIKPVVGGVDGLLAVLARLQRPGLGIDEFLQRPKQVRLTPDFARTRPLALLARVGKENPFRVGPLFELVRVTLDLPDGFRLDGVPVGHLHRRFEHLLERKCSILGEHHHQAAGSAGRDRGQRTFRRRIIEILFLEKLRRGASRGDPEGIDAGDLFRVWIVNQRLRFTAPAQVIVHGADGREHGAGGVHGIAAAFKHAGAGGGAKWFARDRHPVTSVQDRFMGGR